MVGKWAYVKAAATVGKRVVAKAVMLVAWLELWRVEHWVAATVEQ